MLVERLVGGSGELGFTLGAREFGRVFVRFFDELFDTRPRGIVVEQFVVAFFDACMNVEVSEGCEEGEVEGCHKSRTFVNVGKVGAEAGDRFKDGLPGRLISLDWRMEHVKIYRNGPSSAFMVSASRSSTACL